MIDWKYAPDWANYAAMDENGEWWWYENQPVLNGSEWTVFEGDIECHDYDYSDGSVLWSDTLQVRPHD